MEAPKEAFPLTWPTGQARTPQHQRKYSRFQTSFGPARDDLISELHRMGAREIIISTDVPLRRDGLPYADGDPKDPGIAVYFKRRNKPYVIACDTYHRLKDNARAVWATVEALRTIERHGGSRLMEQAFTGFTALPAHQAEPSWWDVLGVNPEATLAEIEEAHLRLAERHHPDVVGGDHELMARINRARDVAREERGS